MAREDAPNSYSKELPGIPGPYLKGSSPALSEPEVPVRRRSSASFALLS